MQEKLITTILIFTLLIKIRKSFGKKMFSKLCKTLFNSKEFLYSWRTFILIGFLTMLFLAFLTGTLKVLEGKLIIGSLAFVSVVISSTGWAYCNWQSSKL